MTRLNDHGQPIGPDLGEWRPPIFPPVARIRGQTVVLEPLTPEHAPALYDRYRSAPDTLWTYLPFGPFTTASDLEHTIERLLAYPDWRAYAVVVDGSPLGLFSYLRIDPKGGVIEIGSIVYSPPLQKTRAATEALFLLMEQAFDLGYRRLEWKCDDLNAESRSAAVRLGFVYEGTFRKAAHYKGRSRDTAWYAIIDDDWPIVRGALSQWLHEDNFDANGRQRRTLRAIRALAR